MKSMMSVAASKAWYVVHTKPRQESRALENLQNQGYECFLPTLQVEKVRGQRVQHVTEPMFNRYLFIELDETTQNWSPIRSTLGVSKLVSFGQQPAKVPSDLVEVLREAPQHVVERLFTQGEAVRVVNGPLQSVEAVFHAYDGDARAFVLIDLLGQPQKLRITLDSLRLMRI